jgi:hypothetical protein
MMARQDTVKKPRCRGCGKQTPLEFCDVCAPADPAAAPGWGSGRVWRHDMVGRGFQVMAGKKKEDREW